MRLLNKLEKRNKIRIGERITIITKKPWKLDVKPVNAQDNDTNIKAIQEWRTDNDK